jgi:hypothetical protein
LEEKKILKIVLFWGHFSKKKKGTLIQVRAYLDKGQDKGIMVKMLLLKNAN